MGSTCSVRQTAVSLIRRPKRLQLSATSRSTPQEGRGLICPTELLAADFAWDDEHGAVVFADDIGRHATAYESHEFARTIGADDDHVSSPIVSFRDDAVDEFASEQFCLCIDSKLFQCVDAILEILSSIEVTACVLRGIEHRNEQYIRTFYREQFGGFMQRVNGGKTSVCRQKYLHLKYFRRLVVACQAFRKNFSDGTCGTM